MRVGIFYPTLNVYGGAEFVTFAMANTLANNKKEVILFVNKEINQKEIMKFFGASLHPSVKIIVMPSKVSPRGLLDFYQTIFRSFILKSKCDLWIDVYSNCVYPWTNILYVHFPYINSFLFRKNFPYLKSGRLRHVGIFPYVFFERNLIDYGGKMIIANSHYTAEEIRKMKNVKVEVLYPPVPSVIFEENPNILFRNPRKNLVVTISRFDSGKGLEKIPFIASLTNPKIKFVIIGRVHCKKTFFYLQKLINKLKLSERVKIFPDISKEELKKILRISKIYLHTAIGEHFGISVVEAMAAGCIPIVHNSGGVKEYVPPEFRYNNIKEAVEKIENEIQEWNPKKAKEMMEISKEFSEYNFSNKFLKLFTKYVREKVS